VPEDLAGQMMRMDALSIALALTRSIGADGQPTSATERLTVEHTTQLGKAAQDDPDHLGEVAAVYCMVLSGLAGMAGQACQQLRALGVNLMFEGEDPLS
jgi:hypothetical protein